ncbi:MAG TPA: SDR family oxidoreductase [Candidatus Binataceae bacterium]|nr:SDR family oxidoreductase [Candidatus Binataceae bacterium]
MDAKETPSNGGVMIVTGASRGIGAAIARIAATRGYAVAVNYASDAAAAQRVIDEIRHQGGRAIAIQGDVSNEEDVVRLFEISDRELGPLGILLNNAGITGGFARIAEISGDTLSRVLAINIAGAFLCAREAVRRLSTRHGGHGGSIINISSRAAQLGGAGEWVHYAASKGAIDTLTVGLAREVASEGIRVNAVAPGLIETELHAAAGAPDRMARLAPTVPIGRAGQAEEVAECVLWLASSAASYVTGSIVPVSGGR